MRSLLFVPAHDVRKLAKALDCGADALIIDLENRCLTGKAQGARHVRGFRQREPRTAAGFFVRVNAPLSGLMLDDLAAVVCAQPYGIMLPKCGAGRDVAQRRCLSVCARGA